MFKDIFISLILPAAVSYITYQVSLKQFIKEKRLEREIICWNKVLDSIYTLKKFNMYWDNALRHDRTSPDSSFLAALDVDKEKAWNYLRYEIEFDREYLPSSLIDSVYAMISDIENLEIDESNYMAENGLTSEIISKHLGNIKKRR
ncbi:hypothetical protein GCM10007938_29870 [Vibrio zhanjiangensis]|uniref:DUF4760 domain-containing protein n=1 Tax=Vibrio zhanjiangensis TaxID=1046128 RepID=A0ABQ6F349_9VIBR|nr:hypothetical protein [Vibrio zhanjiangensis]GLT19205.1 hypothetical protein GCM10007938_29870 [Vibrio zhanjiangensis]